MRRTLTILAIVGALVVTACGGDDGNEQATDTETTATSGPALTPEDAFTEDVIAAGVQGSSPEAAIDLARSACDALDVASTESLAADSAANASPQGDAALSEAATALGLASVFDAIDNDVVSAQVLTIGADHFCPEHRNTIINFAARRGVDVSGL